MISDKIIRQNITIHAPASKVWAALTTPELMKLWLSDTQVDVASDWKTGSEIVFYGVMEGIEYADQGKILQFEPGKVFQYSYLSNFSKLPDEPANYAVLEFTLTESGDQTELEITCSNCVTEEIFAHMNLYWRVTPGILKEVIEHLSIS